MRITHEGVQRLGRLVHPDKIKAAGFEAPQNVLIVPGTDHAGQLAYFVYLVFSETTSDAELAWEKVKPMVHWVYQQIQKADRGRYWPYIRALRESEVPAGMY